MASGGAITFIVPPAGSAVSGGFLLNEAIEREAETLGRDGVAWRFAHAEAVGLKAQLAEQPPGTLVVVDSLYLYDRDAARALGRGGVDTQQADFTREVKKRAKALPTWQTYRQAIAAAVGHIAMQEER